MMHDSVLLVSFLGPVVTLVMFLRNRATYDGSFGGSVAQAQDWRVSLGLFGAASVVCLPMFISRMRAWNRMVSCKATIGERSSSWQGVVIDLAYQIDDQRHVGKILVRPSAPLAGKRKNAVVDAWVDPKAPTKPRVLVDRLVRP
jgi:hypothetical protein